MPSSFNHPHVISNLIDILSTVEQEETFCRMLTMLLFPIQPKRLLVPIFLPNISFSIPQKKESQMGLEQHKGQRTQDNRTAFEDESQIVKIKDAKQALNESIDTEEHNGIFQEQEDFQDQDSIFKFSHCDEGNLKLLGEEYCLDSFHKNMSIYGEENWCNMEMVLRSYHKLTECLEIVSKFVSCYYPNVVVEQLFVRIHQQYFHLCSDEEDLPDAPAEVVLAATLLPILLIPFIVYIVVWKSSLRD